MTSRRLLPGEILIMRTLLDRAYESRWKAIDVESLRASDMDDGGMGSCYSRPRSQTAFLAGHFPRAGSKMRTDTR